MQKKFYLSLAIVGTILPYYFLVSFVIQYGWDIHRIWDQLFLSEFGAFIVMDVFISSIVLWVFIFAEGRRLGYEKLVGLQRGKPCCRCFTGMPIIFIFPREICAYRKRVMKIFFLIGRNG